MDGGCHSLPARQRMGPWSQRLRLLSHPQNGLGVVTRQQSRASVQETGARAGLKHASSFWSSRPSLSPAGSSNFPSRLPPQRRKDTVTHAMRYLGLLFFSNQPSVLHLAPQTPTCRAPVRRGRWLSSWDRWALKAL